MGLRGTVWLLRGFGRRWVVREKISLGDSVETLSHRPRKPYFTAIGSQKSHASQCPFLAFLSPTSGQTLVSSPFLAWSPSVPTTFPRMELPQLLRA